MIRNAEFSSQHGSGETEGEQYGRTVTWNGSRERNNRLEHEERSLGIGVRGSAGAKKKHVNGTQEPCRRGCRSGPQRADKQAKRSRGDAGPEHGVGLGLGEQLDKPGGGNVGFGIGGEAVGRRERQPGAGRHDRVEARQDPSQGGARGTGTVMSV